MVLYDTVVVCRLFIHGCRMLSVYTGQPHPTLQWHKKGTQKKQKNMSNQTTLMECIITSKKKAQPNHADGVHKNSQIGNTYI